MRITPELVEAGLKSPIKKGRQLRYQLINSDYIDYRTDENQPRCVCPATAALIGNAPDEYDFDKLYTDEIEYEGKELEIDGLACKIFGRDYMTGFLCAIDCESRVSLSELESKHNNPAYLRGFWDGVVINLKEELWAT